MWRYGGVHCGLQSRHGYGITHGFALPRALEEHTIPHPPPNTYMAAIARKETLSRSPVGQFTASCSQLSIDRSIYLATTFCSPKIHPATLPDRDRPRCSWRLETAIEPNFARCRITAVLDRTRTSRDLTAKRITRKKGLELALSHVAKWFSRLAAEKRYVQMIETWTSFWIFAPGEQTRRTC